MEENKKYVYLFQEGNAKMKDILGGKGANLAEMTNLGLPIPQGFTISAECCNKYYEDGEKISEDIISQIEKALGKLEEMSGKKFGDVQKPLLVSVRSGARVSMPGMMDTILNLGINDETVKTLAAKNRRFAYDSYRRFIQMYSDVVKGIPNSVYEKAIDTKKMQRGLAQDIDMDANDLEDLVKVFKGIYYNQTGSAFPQDVKALLLECIEAVFKSWNNPRAIKYRRLNDIPGDWGTAVNIQMMVFGNMGDDCGTGVAFSRNPATGENKIYGEFLMNAQGEDVVAGIRTPMTIDKLAELNADVYNEFVRSAKKLEKHYKDMQDLEFTIEHGSLYILQTRNGKRTAQAALQVAVDLVKEGLIDEREAVLRVEPKQLEQLLHPNFDKEKLKFMERNADFNDALEKITLCRKLGFDNINLDLMYAIPGETLKALKKDLSLFLKLNPNHISTYSLILESHTKAYVNGVSEIEEELDYEMYKYITEKLSNAHHYEISNFAIPGYESKHNLVYWNNEEYYGFGLGVSGYIDKIRYTNTKNLKDYLLGNWVKEKEIIGEKEKMDYEIMLGLRKFDGINLENFKKKFGIELEKAYNIEPLLKSKELIKKKGSLYINPIYIYVSTFKNNLEIFEHTIYG